MSLLAQVCPLCMRGNIACAFPPAPQAPLLLRIPVPALVAHGAYVMIPLGFHQQSWVRSDDAIHSGLGILLCNGARMTNSPERVLMQVPQTQHDISLILWHHKVHAVFTYDICSTIHQDSLRMAIET